MTNPPISSIHASTLAPRNAYASGYHRTDTTTVRTEVVAFFVLLYETKYHYPKFTPCAVHTTYSTLLLFL